MNKPNVKYAKPAAPPKFKKGDIAKGFVNGQRHSSYMLILDVKKDPDEFDVLNLYVYDVQFLGTVDTWTYQTLSFDKECELAA